jgi:hypothetical protein
MQSATAFLCVGLHSLLPNAHAAASLEITNTPPFGSFDNLGGHVRATNATMPFVDASGPAVSSQRFYRATTLP